MSYQEFQETLDGCARTKAEYGYNIPRKHDGSVDLDATVKLKFAETQKVQYAYEQYFGSGSGNTRLYSSGHADDGGARPQIVAALSAGAVLAAATVIGGTAMFVRRVVRRKETRLLSPKAAEEEASVE